MLYYILETVGQLETWKLTYNLSIFGIILRKNNKTGQFYEFSMIGNQWKEFQNTGNSKFIKIN